MQPGLESASFTASAPAENEEAELRDGLTRRAFLQSVGAATVASGISRPGSADEPIPSRELGRTGVRVPIIGVGTAPAGFRPRAEAAKFFAECLDRGAFYLDTAPEFAGYGIAQLALGDVLKSRRKDAFLVTKCYEPDGEKALALLKKNLQELQTDYADVVYAHSIGSDKMDLKTVLGKTGVMKALEKAQRDGLARFIGISGHNNAGKLLAVIREYQIQVMMNAVSFVARHIYNFEEALWPAAHKNGIALVAMKVFGGIVGGEKTPKGCRLASQDLPAAFRYAQSLPNLATAVIGLYDRDELAQAIDWARTYRPLGPEEMAALIARGKELSAKWGALYGPAA
jgi:aryl-alcohol dehydrogenase-like predicted oxidoreductase